MKMKRWLPAAIAGLVVLAAVAALPRDPAAAAGTTAMHLYLRIDGVKGESTNQAHRDEIELLSFSYGVTGGGGGAAGGAQGGRANTSDIVVTKKLDCSSPKLYEACCAGTHSRQAILTCTLTGERAESNYYRITLDDLLVKSVTQSGADGGAAVMETVTLSFTRIKQEYYQYDATGKVKAIIPGGWDFATGTKQ